MDDVRQEHVVDASLALLRKLEDDIRVLNRSPKTSNQQLGSSDSSRTMELPNVAERKRKRIDFASSSEDGDSKKLRVSSADRESFDFGPPPRHDMSQQLPAEMWQHIFSLLSPHTLGALLRVCRLFHKYLDPASPFKVSAPVFHVSSILPTMSPDAIWRASRCLFLPKMPAPLREKSELDMWRFACSRSCQICGQLDKPDTSRHSLPWRRGPGNKTVTPIFLFFTNACGDCLIEKSVKEVDLLLSTSVPSIILPGLPMVFLTPDVNVVSPQEIRNTPVSPSVQLTKRYWPAQVESLQAELEDVKRFGLAATEEWIKGLESRGTEIIHDASRWERWRLSGGLRQMLMRSYSISPASTTDTVVRSGIQVLEKLDADVHFSVNHPPQRNPKRRAREVVAELQSERRADIEARAARLQPPIPPSALSNLPSFQAALQKIEPFDGKEWKLLKPRLLAQYKMLKNKEKKSALNTSTQQKLQHQINDKNAKELKNQGQYDIETLLRIHICSLAEQVINDRWGGGRNVQKTNCAHFATEVLAYIRNQFYLESSHASAASLTRRLTLDDMRWIFETKIGPLTNHHRKEFFFCSGCPNSKPYGFHAVVQHYAMKHATTKNSMTLHWKEEWPEEPPFRSSPIQQASAANSTPQHADDPGGISSSASRVDFMARVLKTTWKAIKNARNVPSSVKIYVLIHHIVKEYQEQYLEPAPFEVFLNGLDYHTSFSAVSNSQGLFCKLCMLSQKQDQDSKKIFSLCTLANHFHGVHYKERTPPTDWRVDMVWLPDMQIFHGLQAHIRNNKRVFELTSDAIPWLFKREEENSRGGLVPLRTRQSPATAGLEAVDADSTPVIHQFSDEKFLAVEDSPRLLPASAVYTGLDMVHEEHGYDVSRTQSTGERSFEDHNALGNTRSQYMVSVPDMGSDPSWESVHIGSRTVSSRGVVPEPRGHLSTYYLHREHQPHLAERPSEYPYYPDMELQRERTYVEARTRDFDSRYYIPEGYQQPAPSAPIYRYVESIPSYDRYGIVDIRGSTPNEYYSRYTAMLHENGIPANTDHSNYTRLGPHTNYTAPASRVYDAYASRYTLTNRRSGSLNYDIE